MQRLTVGSTRTPTPAMASPFSWPVLVPYALRAPAPVNLGVIPVILPMHTFFNLKIKETNERMRQILKSHAEPFLKEQGWQGKGSKFKRIMNGQFQTLEFQFNKYGGSFAVNLALVEPIENFYGSRLENLRYIRSQRLGSHSKRIAKKQNMDHWFKFMLGFLIYIPAYNRASIELVKVYKAQAELTFESMQE